MTEKVQKTLCSIFGTTSRSAHSCSAHSWSLLQIATRRMMSPVHHLSALMTAGVLALCLLLCFAPTITATAPVVSAQWLWIVLLLLTCAWCAGALFGCRLAVDERAQRRMPAVRSPSFVPTFTSDLFLALCLVVGRWTPSASPSETSTRIRVRILPTD
jgi:hypothetical protein